MENGKQEYSNTPSHRNYEKIYNKFRERIEEFVQEYLSPTYIDKIPSYNEGKVIHDALWGTQYLKPYELVILDTPLLQRLRQIKQTGFTYLVYPSSLHTRFEHTLGVLYQANKIIEALKRKNEYADRISPYEDALRLAALLHDIGHGPFSHTSEEFYRFCEDLRFLIEDKNSKFSGWTPHEFLAYSILNSNAFQNFFNERIRDKYNKTSLNTKIIARIIVGKIEDPLLHFVQSIINGPFDADKLDYIFRDGHFSGLPLKVDLDRLWYSLQIDDVEYAISNRKVKVKTLTVPLNSVNPLQQVLFSKMVLTASVYHHHKVRALDCMFKRVCLFAKENSLNFGKCNFNYSTGFLWLTDDIFFSYASHAKKEEIHKMLHDILYRRLLKRALVISKATTESGDDCFDYTRLKYYVRNVKQEDPYLRGLAKDIWEAADCPCDLMDVWVDLPSPPPKGMADRTFIKKSDTEFVPLNKIFHVDDWAENYVEHLWSGYVFAPNDEDVRKKISNAAKEVFRAKLNIKFNKFADTICKIN